LNRAKIRVREDSVRVLEEELKSQQERLSAGIVGTLNVRRAEVALANERPELINAQTQLKNSYLRLAELFGIDVRPAAGAAPFEVVGELQYHPNHPDLNDCLARAETNRPVIKARQKDIQIKIDNTRSTRASCALTSKLFPAMKSIASATPMPVPNLITAIWWGSTRR